MMNIPLQMSGWFLGNRHIPLLLKLALAPVVIFLLLLGGLLLFLRLRSTIKRLQPEEEDTISTSYRVKEEEPTPEPKGYIESPSGKHQ